LDALDAVLCRRAVENRLEVEEEAGVAYAVAVEGGLHVPCEVLETFRDVFCLPLVVGVDI